MCSRRWSTTAVSTAWCPSRAAPRGWCTTPWRPLSAATWSSVQRFCSPSIRSAARAAAGLLYPAVTQLARSPIDMARIESPPARRRNWDYLFFGDTDGHRGGPKVASGLEELAEACVFLKVLGSYPQGKLQA